jgi:hypothetical protein
MGRNARQCGQEPNSPAAHHGEKPIKAVMSKQIIHRSYHWRANIRLIGLETRAPCCHFLRTIELSYIIQRQCHTPVLVETPGPCDMAGHGASPTHSAPCMPRASWNLQQNRTASDAGKTTSTVTLPLGGMSMARCCLESLILCRVPDSFSISSFSRCQLHPAEMSA